MSHQETENCGDKYQVHVIFISDKSPIKVKQTASEFYQTFKEWILFHYSKRKKVLLNPVQDQQYTDTKTREGHSKRKLQANILDEPRCKTLGAGEVLQSESNSTLKWLFTMIKWNSSHGCEIKECDIPH